LRCSFECLMKIIPLISPCWVRALPQVSTRYLTIAVLLLPAGFIARPTIAASAHPQHEPACVASTQSVTIEQSIPKVAMQPPHPSSKLLVGSATTNFRLLGYGLFLLQIGLLPLRLAPGHLPNTARGPLPKGNEVSH
jgi:hypothetical protein